MPPRRKRTKVEAAAQIASSSSSITVDASSTRSSVTVDGEVEPSHPKSPATLAVEVVASDEDSDHLFEPPTTRRKRQRTLDGGNANTPPRKAPPVHGRGQRGTPPAAVTSSGGELLPSRKTSSTSSPASSAPLPSFSAEELEAGLVQQLRQANLLAALDRRDIFTTTYEECLHGVDAEDDSEADEGVRNRTFRAPQAWPQQGDIAHFRMAFPCVQRFIIRECQRVARRALDDDNATSAICYASPEDAAREMLGFFTNLLSENDGGLMLLLFLSCPSCRWAGAEVMTEMIGLYELLARSHRYEPSRHPWLKPEDLISSFSFTGTHDESCSCPFGGSHSLIASLLRSSMGSVVVNVSFASLRDVLPMNECLAVYKERVNQLDRILRNKPPPRQSKKKSPPAPHTRSLLAVLDGIVSSEERLEGSLAFISSSFDEDVRTVMDTLVRRKMLFDVTIRVRSECQRCSIQQGSLRIDPWRINVESAMLLMHVGNHVALSLDRHQPQSCQCSSTPMDVSTTEGRELFAMIEFHDAYLMKLRACRAEMNSIAVERTEHDTRQSYAAGSHELFRQQALSVQGMTVRDIVSFAAACNPDAEDNRDEGSVRPPPTIRASLHPHQLENLDQMLAREEFGSTEYTEIPVWSPPMSMKGDAIQRGTFLYCAAVAECIFFPPLIPSTRRVVELLRAPRRGGMLCDDVGLGKTLTVLSLCALDRASAEEAGVVSPTGAERSSASAGSTYSFAETSDPAALRHWRVRYKPSSYGVACDVGHLFERQMRSVLMRAEKVPLRVLPRTTLIVMPVSIVGQWATEIERFCPDSRYIIFHGNKRLRYTAEDFSQADFVLTTFETLGGHLRAESDPVGWMVEQFGREAAGVGEDGRRHMDRWRAVQHLAESIFPSVPEISEGGLTFERMQEASPFVWQMKNSANGEKIFTCSYLRVRVNHEGLGRLSRRNLHYSGEFLDNLIELLLGIESPVADAMTTEEELSTEARNKSSTVVPLWSVLTLLRDHVAVSDKVRKELVGAVVFPLLRRCLQRYWRAMNVPADDVLRFRHFQFRRLVIDEGHLIGSTSLCHLLRADRRWVLSGTPIANFNTTNLAHPLRVLQLPAADAYFRGDRRNMMTGGFSHRSLHFHIMLAKQSVWRRYGSVLPTDAAIPPSIMDAIQTQAFWHSSIAVQDCLCRRCCAELQRRGGLGLGSPRELPSDVLEATEEATHGSENDIQCHRGVLLSMLHQWVIRHERWQIDARTFALPPVEHHAVVVQLDAAERTIYDRVAPLIELVGQRWHRQGLLQRRMGKLLQWIEGLARLCLHAELVRDSVARVRTLEDVQAAAPVQPSVFDAAAAATEYLERITFIECSPQSAVVWAQETEMALLRERGRSNAPRLTESVVKELHDLGEVPPLLPSCGVCLELMQQPTLLSCYHMFCKACILGVVENSWSMRGGSRCPYCRTGLQDAEMRVLQLNYAEEGEADTAEGSSSSASDEASHATPNAAEVPLEVSLEAIGHGSRARAMVELLHSIWSSSPEDGVLVFCKYPDMLRRVAVYVEAELGCLPCVIDGTTTLNRRRKIFGSLQPASVRPPNSEGAYSAPPARRLLFVTTRAANCGLNLTFANHIIFLGPTLNPAVEVQAIGRVHRFGQTKTVHVHHLFTENTIEQRIRERSERLLSQMGSAHTTAATAATATAADGHLDAAERARLTQYGAMAPTDMMQLLSFSPLL